ncbi:MAG: hypothetical protein LBS74_08445 [Oscillospiraceae bacterium]|jgi:hypothetical protein|nr:hypothetical protein [Oscillospiraceae bacterium]
MKKLISIFLICAMLLALSSCGKKNDPTTTVIPAGESSSVESYEVIDPVSLGDTLTSELEGDWMVTGVYQEPRSASKTAEEVLARAQEKAIHLGSDFFEGNGFHIDIPYYKLKKVNVNALQADGISQGNIEKDFSESTDCVEVYDQNEDALIVAFYLSGGKLYYSGDESYILCCEKTVAVG